MDKHAFDGPEHGSCRYQSMDSGPCGYLAGHPVHDLDATETTIRRATPLRTVPDGRARRSRPWSDLPAVSKAVLVFGGLCTAAVVLCLVATLCRVILDVGGWL